MLDYDKLLPCPFCDAPARVHCIHMVDLLSHRDHDSFTLMWNYGRRMRTHAILGALQTIKEWLKRTGWLESRKWPDTMASSICDTALHHSHDWCYDDEKNSPAEIKATSLRSRFYTLIDIV